jgi:hypothetical protein
MLAQASPSAAACSGHLSTCVGMQCTRCSSVLGWETRLGLPRQCVIYRHSSPSFFTRRCCCMQNAEIIKRWVNEVQEAVQSKHSMVQFHAVALLHALRCVVTRAQLQLCAASRLSAAMYARTQLVSVLCVKPLLPCRVGLMAP